MVSERRNTNFKENSYRMPVFGSRISLASKEPTVHQKWTKFYSSQAESLMHSQLSDLGFRRPGWSLKRGPVLIPLYIIYKKNRNQSSHPKLTNSVKQFMLKKSMKSFRYEVDNDSR